MDNTVKFSAGNSEGYKNLENKNSDTIYFVEDTQELYKGDIKVGHGGKKTYIGTEEPTDPNIEIWYNPEDNSPGYQLTEADKTEIANIVINEYDSSIMAILGGDNGVTE